MNVVCIGIGYVGSVTGAALAAWGHKTVLIDVDQDKVDAINSGKSPIYEPGLEELIRQQVDASMLSASTSYRCVEEADVVFICVGRRHSMTVQPM